VFSAQRKLANLIDVRDSLLIVRSLQHHVVDLITDADVVDLTTNTDNNIVDLTTGADADIIGTSDSSIDLTTDFNVNLTDSSNPVSPFAIACGAQCSYLVNRTRR
jgi:hypothetical protein